MINILIYCGRRFLVGVCVSGNILSTVVLVSELVGSAYRGIYGMAVMGAHNRVVTSSFDGAVRVWDLRMFKVVSTALGAGREQLTRVDVAHDHIVAGCMRGGVEMFDCDPRRGEVAAARSLHLAAAGGADA